ncbi:thiazole synthase [Sphingobacterium griseoflavum]|uniref:Thiazole synthase n=1 Tax=Sphingobacterium griseoflavum TaxID=1474952 RepID=A0ABQ3HZ28_9SPHI|nr:thiazole synthase [Sphingobacterium griseoflavum]GHE33596.1 thiazole synthase [Sphingobacterium griseoflavum]
MDKKLKIADRTFESRLFLGTGKFGSSALMRAAISASETEMVTVALKRIDMETNTDELLAHIPRQRIQLLPNTSGARTAKEAVLAAELAREAMETNWVKLEIHPDPKYLLPDPIETLYACEALAKAGFIVLPYIHADPVLCKRLEDVGTAAVMPLGSPIGSNQGLKTLDFLEIILAQSTVPVIVDAGIGAPSDAAKAMELGADAVLVNTAIATADDPQLVAEAFALAVRAGRMAQQARLQQSSIEASSSSPLTNFLTKPQPHG